ncbi:hypothetical protein [Kingella sp. (in: b-proteobacteria)]|uniref:hypothetical protein n=1 Tax=Kingella sp. (in: b-proteobacteria) TaxID=2020713 RepID=UPI0026DC7DB9|nr:hypothetical protein [Kingella sp. (in: b-proteobacteria)]MDO4658474.1 hypothetical protein [Kingella sp. (in: b-proteobacteria)]
MGISVFRLPWVWLAIRQPETLQMFLVFRLKPKMERRLAANTLSHIALLICQDVGEPPTLHRLQVLQRFQAASMLNVTRRIESYGLRPFPTQKAA